MSPRPPKSESRPNLGETIKEIAWKQIAESGASTLTLRAIARDLKITAPAIYNYFPTRDALATALVVDAFQSLADSQKKSIEAIPSNKPAARLRALGLAYRDWALQYPQRYQLIFGTPIAGYEAPEEITLPAAECSIVPLLETIQSLFDANLLRLDGFPKMSRKLKPMLEEWKTFTNGVVDIEAIYLTQAIWSRVHGLVMLEIGKQYPPFVLEPGEFFYREIEFIMSQYIKN